MIMPRSLAVLLACVFALPLIAAAPRQAAAPPAPPPSASASDLGVRVLARAAIDDATAAPSASPAPTPSATPTASPGPSPAPSMSASARVEFEAWQNGKIDLSHYIPEAKAQFTDTAVAQISAQYIHPLGAIKSFTYVRNMIVQGTTVYIYRAVCANGALDELISWTADGKVQFIFFRPPPA
jgi:hypothetical protein